MTTVKDKEAVLERQLQEALEKIRVLEAANSLAGEKQKVVLRHSGNGPRIMVEVDRDTTEELSSRRNRDSLIVDYDVYLALKRSTPFFDLGYIYVDADVQDNDNPNLVLDVEAWVEERTERQIAKDIQEITSIGLMNRLYDLTEGEDSGKMLFLREKAGKRLGDLLGATVIEDSEE